MFIFWLMVHGELWSAIIHEFLRMINIIFTAEYTLIPWGYINDTCVLTFLPQEYNSIPLHWNNQPQNVNDTNLWLPGFFLWSRLGQSAISWWCTVNRRRRWTETCLRGSQSRSRLQWCWEGTEDDVLPVKRDSHHKPSFIYLTFCKDDDSRNYIQCANKDNCLDIPKKSPA